MVGIGLKAECSRFMAKRPWGVKNGGVLLRAGGFWIAEPKDSEQKKPIDFMMDNR
jgi:hypothetical protein